MPEEGAERWRLELGDAQAMGWVDRPRGVGRIVHAPGADDATLLAQLGRRYPGVRWFRDRAG
jgi:hypothetical protein